MENTKSAFLKLGVSDLAKGLSVAVIAVVLGSLSEGMSFYCFCFFFLGLVKYSRLGLENSRCLLDEKPFDHSRF